MPYVCGTVITQRPLDPPSVARFISRLKRQHLLCGRAQKKRIKMSKGVTYRTGGGGGAGREQNIHK